jgi:hypothetical protein
MCNSSSIRARQKLNIAAFLTTNGVDGVVANQRRVGGVLIRRRNCCVMLFPHAQLKRYFYASSKDLMFK